MLQIPLEGHVQSPKINTARVAMRISALTARKTGGVQGQILGTLVDTATDVVNDETPPPPPTTNPLPWENILKEEAKSNIPKPIEEPLKELKKGAKSILKGLLGCT